MSQARIPPRNRETTVTSRIGDITALTVTRCIICWVIPAAWSSR
jgi:hypothetical protein